MALQTPDPPTSPSAQMVANAFVEQYYRILHHSPELVYRFYQESSVLSRQETNGEMTTVTTMQGINEKILSLDYKNFKAEIKTADAQESYNDGVIVLVTGCLTGKDNLRKKFAQSFFLAPQAKGYFVLNDVFRYVDESEALETNSVTIEKVDESGAEQLAVDTDVAMSIDNNQISVETETLEEERQVPSEEKVTASQSTENHLSSIRESNQTSAEEEGVKNSYASIVKKAKDSPGPNKIYVPTNTVRAVPPNTQKKSGTLPAPASVAEPSVRKNSKASESVNAQEEVEGQSIYVRNLPINVTDEQLEQEFKKFGPIRPEGVQVRSNRHQGSCYGFIEFLSASSVESAIQASPLVFRGRKTFVEIKRTATRVDGARSRFPFGRGGFRSESFRGRANYGGGRDFSRNDFGGRGEYSGRGRGEYSGRGRGEYSGRASEGYHRGRGRAGPAVRGVNQNSVAR